MNDPDLERVSAAIVPTLAEREVRLRAWGAQIAADGDRLAAGICAATAKPIGLARVEVERALQTLNGTLDQAARLLPQRHGLAEIHRQPVGPVLAITPFNFPLNLAMHKLAPALLAGCGVLWKPSPKAPGVAEQVVELLRRAWPDAPLRLLGDDHARIAALCADPRLAVLSFTGSVAVGRRLQQAAWRARSVLELGGNAALIWHRLPADPAAVAAAAARAAFGATAQAGQVCISVQRIFVPEERDDWAQALAAAFAAAPTGAADDPITVCGPLIDDEAATRVRRLLADLRAAGGRCLAGGEWLDARTLRPTLIAGLDAGLPLIRDQEWFAPIASLHRYRDLDAALAAADATPFGLQAGLLSDDEAAIAQAFARLQVGTLVVGDIPTRRDDHLPYGGYRDSGSGREGALIALDTYTEAKVLTRVA